MARLSRLSLRSNFNPRSLTGATTSVYAPPCSTFYFNPRSLTGATRRAVSWLRSCGRKFQSTLPHGSDMTITPYLIKLVNFNPRSLTGATAQPLDSWHLAQFQSTLPHGSDGMKAGSAYVGSNFNPRSLTGATHACLLLLVNLGISIHAPSRERPL